MNEVIQSGCLSEEEWDAEACITAEDDGAYFMEDLTESEALSRNIATKEHEEEEEEWDAEAGFAMEVRDSDTCTGFIVFEYDDDEDWETLRDKEEDTRDIKIEPSLHEDEPQEYRAEGALVIHDDLKTRDEVKKLQEGYSCKDLSMPIHHGLMLFCFHTRKHSEGEQLEE